MTEDEDSGRWPYDVGRSIVDQAADDVPKQAIADFDRTLQDLESRATHLRGFLTSKGAWNRAGMTTGDGNLEELGKRVDGLLNRINDARLNLNKTSEVVHLRILEKELTQKVIESWPRDDLASLLVYIALAVFGSGTAVFAYLGYPSLGPKDVPSLILWLFGLTLLAIGFTQLADSQSSKMHYFRTRMGIESPASRRSSFGLYWIPVWIMVGVILASIGFGIYLSLGR